MTPGGRAKFLGFASTDSEEAANGAVEGDILPGNGHFMHQERPQEVNPRILEFLKR